MADVKKIFLASSSELKDDRDNFEKFINELNDDWLSRDFSCNVSN